MTLFENFEVSIFNVLLILLSITQILQEINLYEHTGLKKYFVREMPPNDILPIKTLNKLEIVYAKVFTCLR